MIPRRDVLLLRLSPFPIPQHTAPPYLLSSTSVLYCRCPRGHAYEQMKAVRKQKHTISAMGRGRKAVAASSRPRPEQRAQRPSCSSGPELGSGGVPGAPWPGARGGEKSTSATERETPPHTLTDKYTGRARAHAHEHTHSHAIVGTLFQ